MELLEPLYDRLFEALLKTEIKVLHIDETPLKVINDEKTQCYMFVYATTYWEEPVYIYSFSDTRSTRGTKEILRDYDGYVVCDGYSGYDSLPDQGVKVQRCMVHARRYFNDCLTDLTQEEMRKNPAYRVMELMGKLFLHEEKFRHKKYTASRIKQERNKPYYLNCISKLDRYIDSIDSGLNVKLKKAVNYYKNNRDELYTYLENGYVENHNNLAERVVKPFVIARKSFLFCKTADGADVTAKLFSIVQTARANGLKSEQYLSYCLENIRKRPIEELLPWSNCLPDEVKITQRDLIKKR
jgi:transposase